jgi:hypothetical protein
MRSYGRLIRHTVRQAISFTLNNRNIFPSIPRKESALSE